MMWRNPHYLVYIDFQTITEVGTLLNHNTHFVRRIEDPKCANSGNNGYQTRCGKI